MAMNVSSQSQVPCEFYHFVGFSFFVYWFIPPYLRTIDVLIIKFKCLGLAFCFNRSLENTLMHTHFNNKSLDSKH